MKKFSIYILLATLFLSSCSKDLDEAAINKNNPADVKVSEIFPSAQQAIAYTLGNQYAIYGGIWAQYWTQGSTTRQYLDNEKYLVNNSNQDRPWSQLYAGALTDIKIIKEKSTSTKDTQMYAMALVLEAYTYQLLADAYESVPMTDALKEDVFSPSYDGPTVVYDKIEANLKAATSIFNSITSGNTYSFDLFYGGDLDKWTKFANTLMLRVYLRQTYSRPAIAQAGIAALGSASFISDQTEMPMVRYGSAVYQKNPLHASQLQLANFENLKASNTALNALKADDDLRMEAFYNATAAGAYNGFNQGAGTLPSASTTNTNFSNMGDKVGGANGAATPIIFMSSWESYFLQAEASARGWLGGAATSLYEMGIEESHTYLGFTAADAAAVAALHPLAGSSEDQAAQVVAQKWMAMNGTQCFEGYTELRRMNYTLPYVTFPVSAASVYGAGLMPHRFPYPASEISTNASLASVAVKQVFQKMWFSK